MPVYRYLFVTLLLFFMFSCTNMPELQLGPEAEEKESELYWHLIGPGDADQVTAVSISNNGTVYVSTDIGGVYRSLDRGETWEPINQGIKNYDIETPVTVSPDNEKVLYIGTRGGIYRSVDGGASWAASRSGIGSGKPMTSSLSSCIGAIAISPEDPGVVYAGLGYRPNSEGNGVIRRIKWNGDIYRSGDRGESWQILASLGRGAMIRHIHFSSSGIMYAAATSGLFMSRDKGREWVSIAGYSVKYVTSHPEYPDVLYIAAGERGIFKSMDGGGSWTEINQGLSMRSSNSRFKDNYTQIIVDKEDPDVLYAVNTTWGGGGGVYKSVNSGGSWEKATIWPQGLGRIIGGGSNVESAWLKHSRRVNAIAQDPDNNSRLFMGTSRYIYRTDDGGASWRQLISKEVSTGKWTHRGINVFGHARVVGIDPLDSDRLYIGTADHGLVRSTDGGMSWKQSVNGMAYSNNIYDISVHPAENSVVYAINGKGGFKEAGVARSDDFGESWRQVNRGLKSTMYHTLLLDPEDPGTVFVGGDDGVYMTDNRGREWMPMNKGIEGISVRELVFSPDSKLVIFAATNRGLYRTGDRGVTWKRTHFSAMDLYTVIVTGMNDQTIFVGARRNARLRRQGGVFRSGDGGRSWEHVLGAGWIQSITMLPAENASVIYALSNDFAYHDESSGEGVFRSVDGGDTWRNVNRGLAVLRGFKLNAAPYSPYRVYLSTQGSGSYYTVDPDAAESTVN